MTKEIRADGLVAIVDDEDYEWLSRYKWRQAKQGGRLWTSISVPMHRLILGLRYGDPHVDHKDRNPLNNRKSNLRLATQSQNNANKAPAPGRFKGVRRPSGGSGWMAGIRINGKWTELGIYDTAKDAARAYDIAAKKMFGEFAYINLPGARWTPKRRIAGRTKRLLSVAQVKELRRRHAAGETQVSLAREFGISQPTVSTIARKTVYKEA